MKSLSPYNLRLVPYQKVSMKDISTDIHKEIKELLLKSKLNIDNINLNLTTTKTRFGGDRYWIECPRCKRRVGDVYCVGNEMVCRKCLC
jgi:hypothetical protein